MCIHTYIHTYATLYREKCVLDMLYVLDTEHMQFLLICKLADISIHAYEIMDIQVYSFAY